MNGKKTDAGLTLRQSIEILIPYAKRYKRAFFTGFGCLVLKNGAGVCAPLVLRNGVNALTRGESGRSIALLALLLLAVCVLKGIFQYFTRLVLVGVSRDIEYDLRNDLFGNLVKLPPEYFAGQRTGDIMARATNDLNAVRMMLGPGVMYLSETTLTTLFAVAIMVGIDWRLTTMALLPAPLVSFAVVYFGQRIHERFERIQGMFSDISSRVQENLAGVRIVRAFAQEQAEIGKFESLNREYIRQNLRLVRLQGIFEPLLELLIGFTFLAVLWAGGAQVMQHRLSLGEFVMFNTYMGMLVWPMIALGWVVNLIQRGTASLGRIVEVLHQEPSIAAPLQPNRPAEIRGNIRFENVTVQFGNATALRDVSFEIEAGQTVAMVGHTGSGKSTAASLIPRLLDVSAGRVLLDGIDVREYDPAVLRRAIGFVPQESFLFSATLGENVAFGREGASAGEIRRAAETAGLATDIADFPAGYETIVGERGITLSGGQKQRTAIARAVIREAPVLILDDALASVDTLTEDRILTGLGEVFAGRTVILISHRISTVRQADRILVLEHGRIAESGTHDELNRLGGYYSELVSRQMLEDEITAA